MDCPPPMVVFDIDRTTDCEITTSVGWEWTPTRQVYVKYKDNRESYDKVLWLSGEANITNWRTKTARIKYRHAVEVDSWLRPKIPHDSPVCFEDGFVVGYWETILFPTATATLDIGWSVNLYDKADFNQDGVVDAEDLGVLMVWFGSNNEWHDLDGDGIVNGYDLGLFFSRWTG